MKAKLQEMLDAKEARKAEIVSKIEASKEITEVKSLTAELDSVTAEIRDLKDMISSLPDEADARTAAVNAQVPKIIQSQATSQKPETKSGEDKFSTIEYRKQFMDYVIRGTPISAEYRDDTFTSIADAAALIPTTIMSEIIKEMKVYGQLYSRVRKTSVQGGVQYPILSLKPVATRITEAAVSSRQKAVADTFVTFSYIGLECKIATGLLASLTTIPAFEAALVPLIVEAMVKKQEIEIIRGVGTTEMLGVINDPRVLASQNITLSSTEFQEWDTWKKKVFAKIPLAYRTGVFVMGAGTFDGYIDGMVDANGQPIGRTNYGITDGTQYRFGGKEVIEVEEDVIAGYDTASAGDVVAVFMNPSDYAINSNMQMAMYRWFDHDTNQWIDKALLVNDGKLLDPKGVFIIKKGA